MGNTDSEEWRDIEGYEDKYFVSSSGRVFTSYRGGKIRRLKTTNAGYLSVRLQGPSGDKMALVHQLVCKAFHGDKPSPKHIVAHNDGNRKNNSGSNLRWATYSENLADRNLHGTAPVGERNNGAKLKESQVFEIKSKLASGTRPKVLATEYMVSQSAIYSIASGSSWRHLS